MSNFLFAIPQRHDRPITQIALTTPHPTLMLSLEQFVKSLEGVKSGLSIATYRSDLRQYFAWLTETDYTVTGVELITRGHIEDYLAHLSDKGQTGTTRVCKLISLQVFFAHLVDRGILPHSPAEEMKRPRREQKTKHYLRPDEYSRVLAEAAGDPRNLKSPPLSRQFFNQIRLRCSLVADLGDAIGYGG